MSKQLNQNIPEIHIAIITTTSVVQQLKEVILAFPNFKPFFHIIDKQHNFIEAIETLMTHVEVMMFTDSFSYLQAQQHCTFTIPVHHMPGLTTGLYRSLFLVCQTLKPAKLSVDTIEEKYLNKLLNELEHSCELQLFELNKSVPPIEDIIEFHTINYYDGAAIITCIPQVATHLVARAIPFELVTPTKQDMSVAFERSLLSTTSRRNKETQIVYGLLHCHNIEDIMAKSSSPHLLKQKIEQAFAQYVQSLDGHGIHLVNNQYAFMTTRGIFERETRGYKFIPLLKILKENFHLTTSLGVGFGRTAAESGGHAIQALHQSMELNDDVCYIVREDQSVIGPVDLAMQTNYECYPARCHRSRHFAPG